MKNTRTLSKKFLEEQGIKIEIDASREWGYKILHKALKQGTSKNPVYIWRELKPCINKHKPGKYSGYGKIYYLLSWSTKMKAWCFPLARIIYVYFGPEEELDPSLDIDHIDNNPFNNEITNLQPLSRSENIGKRYMAYNQWVYVTAEQVRQEKENK